MTVRSHDKPENFNRRTLANRSASPAQGFASRAAPRWTPSSPASNRPHSRSLMARVNAAAKSIWVVDPNRTAVGVSVRLPMMA